MKKIIYLVVIASIFVSIIGCGISSPILEYSESKSKFNQPTKLISNNYPEKDIYWIYQRASSGFTSIQSLRDEAYRRAKEFAEMKGKSFIVLGEQISNPPYILGNFQRIEVIFALSDGTPQYVDVVYLKNGGVIRGMIIEQTPNVQIKIQTKDGSIFVYKMDEIEKMAKESSK